MRSIAEVLRRLVDRIEAGDVTRDQIVATLNHSIDSIIDLPEVGDEHGII